MSGMSGIDNPEKYLINPSSPEAQQAAMMAQQQAQMAQELEQQKQDYLTNAQLQLQTRQVDNQQAEVMRNYEADKEELSQKYAADGNKRIHIGPSSEECRDTVQIKVFTEI